ncbi:MAG: Ig-like domain-containing protein [Actinomycetia bacterium]|nr:Ig-like domain-containing protein [Actinomycetes bacterium]
MRESVGNGRSSHWLRVTVPLLAVLLAMLLAVGLLPSRARAAISGTDGAATELEFEVSGDEVYVTGCSGSPSEIVVPENIAGYAVVSVDLSWRGLSNLDVSACKSLRYLDCSGNQLAVLDISANPLLEELYCYDNQLTSLNTANNQGLVYLSCANNQLTGLDINANKALRFLYCEHNLLKSLDIGANAALVYLDCFGNYLTDLQYLSEWLKGNEGELLPQYLENSFGLECCLVDGGVAINGYSGESSELAVPEKIAGYAVRSIDLPGHGLTGLDVSDCTALEFLNCDGNGLKALDVSANPALRELRCYGNGLTVLDVSHSPMLRYLSCGYNQLAGLDVSANQALQELYCYNNQLTGLDISANSELGYLDCSCNNISDTVAIEEWLVSHSGMVLPQNMKSDSDFICHVGDGGIYITGYKGSMSDVIVPEKIVGADVLGIELLNNWNITALDVSRASALRSLSCFGDSQLNTLDVSGCLALRFLNCSGCPLVALDLSGCEALLELDCSGCSLTALDVSNNPALRQLDCSANQLMAIDLGGCEALRSLDCSANQLGGLDIGSCAALDELYCQNNCIADVSGLAAWLKSHTGRVLPQNASGVPSLPKTEAPVVTVQPVSAVYSQGAKATALSVVVAAPVGSTLAYQWYVNSTAVTSGAKTIKGATAPNYIPNTLTRGNSYYFCKVKTSMPGTVPGMATVTSAIASVRITAAPTDGGDGSSSSDGGGGNAIVPTPPTAQPPAARPSARPSALRTVRASGIKTQVVLYIVKGTSLTLPAAVQPYNATNRAAIWTSSNPKVAKVKAGSGRVVALKLGSAKLTAIAADGRKKASCKVYVVAKATKLKSFSIGQGKAASIVVGKSLVLVPRPIPAKACRAVASYASSNRAVATVDAVGVVWALAPGKTTITVKMGGKTQKLKLTVSQVTATRPLTKPVLP